MPLQAGADRVAFLGPAGTFSEEALLAGAQERAVVPVAMETIYDVILALVQQRVEWALAPVENSLDGSITTTLDLLAENAGTVEIVGETLLGVSHALIAARSLALSEIDTVLSHPKVPGQCSRLLRGELAHARILAAPSTADAVRQVVQQRRDTHAALGTRLAAEIYGGTILREAVEDRDDNETRFLWLGLRDRARDRRPPPAGSLPVRYRTSLVFWGAGADRPGWLVRCLGEFAAREINLLRIESRPQRERIGHYIFFVDLDGRIDDESVAVAVAGLSELCEEVLTLGSYPAGLRART